MQLFYCPGIQSKELFLVDEEARHCTKVLRKKAGDLINITDGHGTFYEAKLTDLSPKRCSFELLNSQKQAPSTHHIHIAIAPTKNIDRTEWFVEKSIEIGVNEISFITTTYSERKKINLERINKKAISAIKQSVRAYLPTINEIQNFSSFLKKTHPGTKFVAHIDENSSNFLNEEAKKSNQSLVVIGPEGGFSDDEIQDLHQQGFKSVKLGNYRLRTETAGVMASAILNTINHS